MALNVINHCFMGDDPQIIAKPLWEDLETTGRIIIQLQHLFAQAILNDQKDRFYTHAFSVMHKLAALKYHLQNHRLIEQAQYEQIVRELQAGTFSPREAFELIFEAEAFLFQVKSSLDMLVKLIDPVLGDNRVRTHTFGRSGDDAIKGLQQYAKQKDVNVEAVNNLIKVIELHQEGWIKNAIDLRDKFSHIKGLNDYKFSYRKLPTGEIFVIKPMLKGIETLPFFETVFHNSKIFHQDFMVYALALRAPRTLLLAPENEERAQEQWKNFGQFVKFCWEMVPPRM